MSREHAPKNGRSWKKLLTSNESGTYRTNEYNVIVALEHSEELSQSLLYDSFADQIRITRPLPWHTPPEEGSEWQAPTWKDRDRIELQVWLQANGLMVSHANVVQDSVIAVAYRNEYHPVRAYLRTVGGCWDGVPRLKIWLSTYLGARDNREYLEAVGPRFLRGAVARAMNTDTHGVQMDTMLVLEGSTGLGKSSAVRILSNGWCTDVANQLHDKDAAITIQGVWFGELGELASLARSMLDASKAFISRVVDKYRPPYGRNAIERPRQCVFIATTEEQEYLQDLRNNRRFWPIDCGKIDLIALKRDREQLWAEAFAEWQAGLPCYLDKRGQVLAYRAQHQRRRISTIETTILEFADQQRERNITRIDMRTFLVDGLDMQPEIVGTVNAGPTAKEVSRVITANGWIKQKPRGYGRNRAQIYEYDADRDPSVMLEETDDDSQAHK